MSLRSHILATILGTSVVMLTCMTITPGSAHNDPCPFGGQDDSANCFLMERPWDVTFKIWNGRAYYTPHLTNPCPNNPDNPFTVQYDSRNCWLNNLPDRVRNTAWLYQNRVLYYPGHIDNSNEPCPYGGYFDSVNCKIMENPPTGPLFKWNGNWYYPPNTDKDCSYQPVPPVRAVYDGANCLIDISPEAKPFLYDHDNKLYVEAHNHAPVAHIERSAGGAIDEPIVFRGTGSNDSDGTVTVYEWDFGDQESGNGPVVTHTYKRIGQYRVTLAIKDNRNASSGTETIIGIVEGYNAIEVFNCYEHAIYVKVADITAGTSSTTMLRAQGGSNGDCLPYQLPQLRTELTSQHEYQISASYLRPIGTISLLGANNQKTSVWFPR